MLTWPSKTAGEVADYRWTPSLDSGDAVQSAILTRLTGSVVIDDQIKDATGLTAWLSGGMPGATVFHAVATTTGGRTFEEVIVIGVVAEPALDTAAYGTDGGFLAWLDSNGYSLPAGASSPPVLRARGSAYVDGYEPRWTGHRTGGVMQELAWPRTGATVNCTQAVPDDAIPRAVVAAAYRAAWLEAETPGVLVGASAPLGTRVKREKVEGAVEVEYFDDGKALLGGGPTFVDSIIDGMLRQFVCDNTGAAFMWSLGS